jgi:hypothetical protein
MKNKEIELTEPKNTVKEYIDKMSEIKTLPPSPTRSASPDMSETPGIKEIDITFEKKESLSEFQKAIISDVYNKSKTSLETIFNNASLDNAIKVTQTIGQIAKLVESMKVDNKPLSGDQKKLITLEVCRLAIKDLVHDINVQTIILQVYDTIAESTLEFLIDITNNINISDNNEGQNNANQEQQHQQQQDKTKRVISCAMGCITLISSLLKKKSAAI